MSVKVMNGLDLNGQKITNLADPSANTDAVNLQYVQNLLRGLIIKDAVRVASTTNVTVAAPGATIDGVTMAANDRVLLKDQSTASQNGLYTWNGAAVAMTRTADADTGTELRPGTIVYVAEGTVNGDKSYAITSDAAITIGTSSMTWTAFGGGSSYTQGNGINISGSVIAAVAAAGGGLVVSGAGIGIDTAVVARKFAVTIGNGSSTTIAVNHALGTKDVIWSLRQVADDAYVLPDVIATDANNIAFSFAAAPTSNSLRAVVMG